MFDDQQSIQDMAVAVSVFGLVLALWFMAMLARSRRRSSQEETISKRLRPSGQRDGENQVLHLWHEGRETTMKVRNAIRLSTRERLDQLFREAGWDPRVRTRVLAAFFLGTPLIALITYAGMDSALPGVGIALLVAVIFFGYLRHRVNRRAALFETQLVGALELAARSLRAGHPLVGAFNLVSEETAPPVGTLFTEICQQQELGVNLEDSIREAALTSGSADMRLFATSVLIQMQTGGNLADMMERVAMVIRDRIRLNRRVKILTAQTQFSKRILLAIPLIVFALLNVIDPEYISPLYSRSEGKFLLAVGTLCLLAGAWVMNRLAILKY